MSNWFKKLIVEVLLICHLGSIAPEVTPRDGVNYFEERRKLFLEEKVNSVKRPIRSVVPRNFYQTKKNCNPHNFNYMINQAGICSKHRRVFLVFIIRSILPHYDRRMVIRNTWGKAEHYNGTAVVVFLFANTRNKELQKIIEMESDMHEDIIQEDFVESYTNMTLKAVMAWKWAVNFCPNADSVMVMNDEAFVDPFKIVPTIQQRMQASGYLNTFTFCYLLQNTVGHLKMKKFTSLDPRILYHGNRYPPYCHGVAYVAPIQLINRLYLMSLETPHVMPSDVWIGIMAEKLGIRLFNSYRFFAGLDINKPLLPVYTDLKYSSSPPVIGVTDIQYEKRESIIMNYVWFLIKSHHSVRKSTDCSELSRNKYDSVNYQEPTFYVLIIVINIALILITFPMWKKIYYLQCRS